MDRGAQAATEALEWRGTKFQWQQSTKGVSTDCKGLIWGVARECGFPEANSIYANMIDYSDQAPVPSAKLREGMDAVFDRIPFADIDPLSGQVPGEIEPGDVLLLAKGGPPSHLAIVTFEGAVHAQLGAKSWVKETRLDVLLRAYQLRGIYRWKELGDG